MKRSVKIILLVLIKLGLVLATLSDDGCDEVSTKLGQTIFGSYEACGTFFLPSLTPSSPGHREKRDASKSLSFRALGRDFSLTLSPSNNIIAPDFAFLVRDKNATSIVDFDENGLGDCLYQGASEDGVEMAALNICNGMRGLVSSSIGDSYYLIEPMPNSVRHRRSIASDRQHIIVRKRRSALPFDPDIGEKRRFYYKDNHRRRTHWLQETSTESIRAVNSRKFRITDLDAMDDPPLRPKPETRVPETRVRLDSAEVSGPVGRSFIELAVFVDKDLYRNMRENFPVETEQNMIHIVLAMINAVQLLFTDKSLGHNVEILIKRLEILKDEPSGLLRSYDIDRYLTNFCKWQNNENPGDDSTPLHWDHALILTGLDLYAVAKDGRLSNQVVGLAPVSGMCMGTSSCTVNEGRHFESVYVIVHELGHNLGMRHDGRRSQNECDPGAYLMSPTLGSGKTTWSSCSRRYLKEFLQSSQASCLSDSGPIAVDHFLHPNQLPGERFSADIQCKLKYGKESHHSKQQRLSDICRDLHCRRDHYTWTSHPALEGTKCEEDKWCRRGDCVPSTPDAPIITEDGPVDGQWSSWSAYSECKSSCLLAAGSGRKSMGIRVSSRRCDRPKPQNGGKRCIGGTHRHRICNDAEQCQLPTSPQLTVSQFVETVCKQASLVNTDILPYGENSPGECVVRCFGDSGAISRGWTLPDGTSCGKNGEKYCIRGNCQTFTCSSESRFLLPPSECDEPSPRSDWTPWTVASPCSFSCLVPARGLQIVERKCQKDRCHGMSKTFQLCSTKDPDCSKPITPFQHASDVCSTFRNSRLSGIGMQLRGAGEDPDRACRVACQDNDILYRFYLVTGPEGWFPVGTDCGQEDDDESRFFCVRGKCLEFGPNGTPLFAQDEDEIHLNDLGRRKRSLVVNHSRRISSSIEQTYLQELVNNFDVKNETTLSRIDFGAPVDLPQEERTGATDQGGALGPSQAQVTGPVSFRTIVKVIDRSGRQQSNVRVKLIDGQKSTAKRLHSDIEIVLTFILFFTFYRFTSTIHM